MADTLTQATVMIAHHLTKIAAIEAGVVQIDEGGNNLRTLVIMHDTAFGDPKHRLYEHIMAIADNDIYNLRTVAATGSGELRDAAMRRLVEKDLPFEQVLWVLNAIRGEWSDVDFDRVFRKAQDKAETFAQWKILYELSGQTSSKLTLLGRCLDAANELDDVQWVHDHATGDLRVQALDKALEIVNAFSSSRKFDAARWIFERSTGESRSRALVMCAESVRVFGDCEYVYSHAPNLHLRQQVLERAISMQLNINQLEWVVKALAPMTPAKQSAMAKFIKMLEESEPTRYVSPRGDVEVTEE